MRQRCTATERAHAHKASFTAEPAAFRRIFRAVAMRLSMGRQRSTPVCRRRIAGSERSSVNKPERTTRSTSPSGSTCSRRATSTAARSMKELLGGKGANLAEMASLGLPVPPGFTITTEVCTAYYANGRKLPDGPRSRRSTRRWRSSARSVGATFGDVEQPLLVSVRSGARASMPGMMDTILNLGLNDETVEGPGRATRATSASPTTATAASSRCMPTWCSASTTACSRTSWRTTRTSTASRSTPSSGADDWLEIIEAYKAAVERRDGKPFPQARQRAALGRHRRGVRLLAERARQDLSPPARHSRQLGHGRQRAGHGVRQPRRRLGHRRRLHAQSLDRRRARSTASSCSTRRARTWSPASARRSR